MMVGNNLKEVQLQQIVDKTILQFDKDGDGKISFQEFCDVSLPSPFLLDSHLVWSQFTFKLKCLIKPFKILSFTF